MKTSDILASIGVIVLLVAFVLNLYKLKSPESKTYTLLNFAGAALCCYSSYLIRFYPFVVLEAIWATFALISFIKILNVPRGTLK
jgi:hypothetical protein